MEHVLVATDLSVRAEPAIRRAALLALTTSAHLHVVHVVDDTLPAEFVSELKEHAQAWIAPHLPTDVQRDPPEVAVRQGDPHAEILAAADEVEADLIVLGAHRHRPLLDEFVGTTAERLLRTSSRPVLVVHDPEVVPYRRVLAAVDLSDLSAEATRASVALGLAPGRIEIVHAFTAVGKGKLRQAGIDPSTLIESERADAGQRLVAFLGTQELGDTTISDAFLREGRAAVAILGAAKERRAQLLVLGTRGLGGIRRAVLGSVAAHVIRSATCDVLAVPPSIRR